MRKYYPRPHFLPKDAEIPNRDYIFFGYNEGATMHVRFIVNPYNLGYQLLINDLYHIVSVGLYIPFDVASANIWK